MNKFPRLYSRAKTGAIKQWEIEVNGNEIITTYGKLNGKLMTAKFQELTADSIPRFPTGIAIREDIE